ncbi:MAG TPA: ABC transporter permease, partial [Caulobacteraceae bacterium]|nr:ABC transporter permease [Caulobacteraceae bacterium]
MSFFREIWAVTAMNLAALPSRALASLVTVIGVATVIAVMLSLLAVGTGVLNAGLKNLQPDRAIVLTSQGAEFMGSFSQSDVAIISQAPGVAKTADGKPIVQPNAAVLVELDTKTGKSNTAAFQGTGAMGRLMVPSSFHIIRGRDFQAGLHELIAGVAASRTYKNLDVGDTVTLRGTPWKVVGVFEDKGGVDENSIVADADTVLAAFNRTSYQSVSVKLATPDAFRQFKDALTSNPQLQVKVERAADYYLNQLKPLTNLLGFVGYFVGGVMAVGVVFGALNTMYSAVDARKREIATLRALGFGGTAVVISVIVESLILS